MTGMHGAAAASEVTELVVARGGDAAGYLDSQCTQDLSSLEVGGAAQTLLLDPAGTIVTLARVTRPAVDVVELEVPLGTGAAAIARLERFAIRTDVTFAAEDARGADRSRWLADELARITAGVPGPAEIACALVPHGLDEELRAECVSYTKGCYPGQELVARMQSRGATPPYVLRRYELDAESRAGDALGDPDKDGRITSVALDEALGTWQALGVVHRKDAGSEELEVRSGAHVVVARLARGRSLRS